MQAVLSHLLASLLLIQALTGWCWHCPHDTCSDQVAEAKNSSTCCCHESRQHDDSTIPEQCPRECQGFCVYVSSVDTQVDLLQLDISFHCQVQVIDSLLAASPAPVAWDRIVDSVDSRPPLRLHLLNQSLLI